MSPKGQLLIWLDTNDKEKKNKLKESERDNFVNLRRDPHPPTAGRLVGGDVGFGELTPEENDINAFRVSSNGDVYRFCVNTKLVRIAISARQQIPLILTEKNKVWVSMASAEDC